MASRVLVDYTRSGGLAGSMENLFVYEDRSAVYSWGIDGSREFKGSAETMQWLERSLPHATEILDRQSPSEEMCADCFQYDLTFEGTHYLTFDLQIPGAAKTAFAVPHEGICQGYPPNGGYCIIPEPRSGST